DRLHVDDGGEVVDVGRHQIDGVGGGGAQRLGVGQAFHVAVTALEDLVGALLHDVGDVGVGRAAVGRVVLEAAVGRRVVAGGDDDAVGQAGRAALVVGQDGVRHDRGGRESVVVLDPHIDAVGRQDVEGGALGGIADGVGVLAHDERAGDALGGAVL